ncbi:arylsulfatase [Oceaniferula marina]|nr:arylsulfatase [Oceaniferula marina]
MMNTQPFFSFLAVTSAVLSLSSMAADAEPSPMKGVKPNIILVITDDQGYADISAHGHPLLKTPHLDQLRAESMSFESFHASPTCAPTRSAIMSGRDPFYVGVTHTVLERERMALNVPTLAEMLKENGYHTGIFGKWHLGDEAAYRPDKRGFDEVYMHGAGGIGQSYGGTCGDAPGNQYFNPYILHNNTFVKTEGFCTDLFFNQAILWMKKMKDEKKPFFTYLSTNAPHGPFISPEHYKKPFAKAGYNAKQQGFYGMIANIDERMGTLMAQLEEWKIADDTILIFMSDNGPTGAGNTWNAGMKGKKGSVDEGGTRVPFFIRWPKKISADTRCQKLVRHYDILPTLAAITGATPKEKKQLAGRSFLPLLENPEADWADRITVFHKGRWGYKQQPTKNKSYALRSGQWRLVDGKHLYDIQKDPLQKKNVIKNHPEVVQKMTAYYDAWWEKAVPLMVNENAPLEGHNTFHLMFWKQFNLPVPPVNHKKPFSKKRN